MYPQITLVPEIILQLMHITLLRGIMMALMSIFLVIIFLLCITTDVEQVWSIIKQCLTTTIDLFIPKVWTKTFQYPMWFSSDLRHQLKCLHTLCRKV